MRALLFTFFYHSCAYYDLDLYLCLCDNHWTFDHKDRSDRVYDLQIYKKKGLQQLRSYKKKRTDYKQ